MDANKYFQNKDWGYEQHSVYAVPINGARHYEGLKSKYIQDPHTISISGTKNHIGSNDALTNIKINDNDHQVVFFDIGFQYLETMGFKLVDGRFFNREIESDKDRNIIINETFVEKMEWENPLEQTIWYDSTRYNIIGVVEDFHYESFYDEIYPVFMRIVPQEEFNYFVVKVDQPSDQFEAGLKQNWKEVEPDLPYEGFNQANVLDNFFQNLDANFRVIAFLAIVSLLLSCMGLFGLVSYNVRRRMKEFSIRKVFGANILVLIKTINKGYIWILFISLIIGGPVAYVLMDGLFELMFPDRNSIGVEPFLIGAAAMLVTAFATTSTQIYKLIKTNPAHTLRNE